MTTILITGSTDGIGLATAHALARAGHTVVLHGRSEQRLQTAVERLRDGSGGEVGQLRCDLADLTAVAALADRVVEEHPDVEVLVNNAGVVGADTATPDGLDPRFAVNTLAPYLLTSRLADGLGDLRRVVNLSSAAQSPVDDRAWTGGAGLADMSAYAQSKFALTAWTAALGRQHRQPMICSVNPGSLLGTKMVRQAFGTDGNDVGIGVEVLVRATLSDEFADAHGRYYDNDARRFDDSVAAVTDTDVGTAILNRMQSLIDGVGS